MEACSRSRYSDTLVVIGVDSLVAFVISATTGVVDASLNIRREWHNTETLGKIGDGFVSDRMESHSIIAIFSCVQDFCSKFTFYTKSAAFEGFLTWA